MKLTKSTGGTNSATNLNSYNSQLLSKEFNLIDNERYQKMVYTSIKNSPRDFKRPIIAATSEGFFKTKHHFPKQSSQYLESLPKSA